MNYQRIYDEFIKNRKSASIDVGYFERHHIIPRSLGGKDYQDNIIKLSASDHFFAHRLLAKIHGGTMWTALFFMCKNCNSARGYIAKRRVYELARLKQSEHRKLYCSGKNAPNYGKKFSFEIREKMKANRPKFFKEHNHQYDHRKFNFQNLDTGQKIYDTRLNFCIALNLDRRPVAAPTNFHPK